MTAAIAAGEVNGTLGQGGVDPRAIVGDGAVTGGGVRATRTDAGAVRSAWVLVATNGYSDGLVRDLRNP